MRGFTEKKSLSYRIGTELYRFYKRKEMSRNLISSVEKRNYDM